VTLAQDYAARRVGALYKNHASVMNSLSAAGDYVVIKWYRQPLAELVVFSGRSKYLRHV
jgi:hypothetical protein